MNGCVTQTVSLRAAAKLARGGSAQTNSLRYKERSRSNYPRAAPFNYLHRPTVVINS